MLRFDDDRHKFTVAAGNSRPQLEFGNRLFFTTLAAGLPIQNLEQVLQAGGTLFGSGLVFPALSFHAEGVVLMPKATSAQFPEQQLMGEFEFGFVQGLKSLDVHLDYWGQVAANGRSTLHINLPQVFEVDTDASIQPWTRVSASRFELRNVTQAASQFNALKISADFTDHPMYVFVHTVQHTLSTNLVVPHFIRSVSFKREFRTIFSARNKKDNSFTPISSTAWIIEYDHTVNYSQNGATRTVTSNVTTRFPSGGSPSNVNTTDRQIMGMATAGSPLVTQQLISTRLGPTGSRTVTRENTNADFVSSFWS
jgi:hypothetical protein